MRRIWGFGIEAVPDHVWRALSLYQRCKALGMQPKEGGLLDQDELTVQQFMIFEDEQAEWAEEERKMREAESRAAGAAKNARR